MKKAETKGFIFPQFKLTCKAITETSEKVYLQYFKKQGDTLYEKEAGSLILFQI